jgi:D-alanyl-D-alanine dipeptidase
MTSAKNTSKIPEGFVYLSDIDPSIQQNLVYYNGNNFAGRRIEGYEAPTVIVTRQAAEGLKQVQSELKKEGYSLVIYDAYRPQKAVDYFIKWSNDLSDVAKQKEYYPYVDKSKVFELGYIAAKSGHSRGSTVDISIIKLGDKIVEQSEVLERTLLDGRSVSYLKDGSVDMYTSVDLFDEASHHDTNLIPVEYLQLRNYLKTKMLDQGFQPYDKEWWHYTLKNEPFPDTYFNFDVVAPDVATSSQNTSLPLISILVFVIGIVAIMLLKQFGKTGMTR